MKNQDTKYHTYNLEWLLKEVPRKSFNYLLFWGHRPGRDGSVTASCFSQWWQSDFMVDEIKYPTAEHWMMAQKAILFKDEKAWEKILMAESPAKAKKLGRGVLNFNQDTWNQKRFSMVCEGNYHKFKQNPELKEFLLNTKKSVLVEASPVDRIWGIGLSANDNRALNPRLWKGKNLLGFALMEVRKQLKEES